MRIYHFVDQKYGLEDIRQRRLKISQVSDLNDPFELLGANLSDRTLRRLLPRWKDTLAKNTGIICFTRRWSNPVVWSHYADRHQGLCLGFDVPDEHCFPVSYTARRIACEFEDLQMRGPTRSAALKNFLVTKYAHWKYENEIRYFCGLDQSLQDGDLFFEPFSERLKLVRVVVGVQSTVSRIEIARALDDLGDVVEAFKARLSFRSFRIVKNRQESLWR